MELFIKELLIIVLPRKKEGPKGPAATPLSFLKFGNADNKSQTCVSKERISKVLRRRRETFYLL